MALMILVLQQIASNFKLNEMKKILISLICVILIKSDLKAQITTFDTCQYIYQFNGEWMYANGNDTIRIFLRAQRNIYTDFNSLEDRVFGWHEYKQGNTIIESTYQNRFMAIPNVDTITNDSFSIWLKSTGSHCNSNLISASGTITDYLQAKEGKSVTVTLDATGTIMTWEQRHGEGYGLISGATGMTLPRLFTLIKQ